MTDWAPSFVQGRPLVEDALRFAPAVHSDQRRAVDDAPFVVHPLEVAMLLSNRGHPDEVVVAGLLHDAVEQTAIGLPEVTRRFGTQVAELVAALSDDPSIADYSERKEDLRRRVAAAGPAAAAVYAADKVCKVRELRAQAGREPQRFGPGSDEESTRRRIAHYVESLRMLEAVAPREPLVAQLRFELEVHRCLSPG